MSIIPYQFLRAPLIDSSRLKATFVFAVDGYDGHTFTLQLDHGEPRPRGTINGAILLEGPCQRLAVAVDGRGRVETLPREPLGAEDINPMLVPGARDPRFGSIAPWLRSPQAAADLFDIAVDALLLPTPPAALGGVDAALTVLAAVAALSAAASQPGFVAQVRGDHCVAQVLGGDLIAATERLGRAFRLLGFDGGREAAPHDVIPLARRRRIDIAIAGPSAHARMAAAARLRAWAAEEPASPERGAFVSAILTEAGIDFAG